MNDTARRLRAQIPASTDPDWLERMACAAERAASRQPAPAQRRAAIMAPELSGSISNLSQPVNATRGTRR
jgi:hypothetical protein